MLRESKIVEQMELLGIKDITTPRQARNGTVIWKLPIKKYGQFIEVGSFKSGYVRRMNGGYTPYQLNKTEKYDHYYKLYDYSNDNSPKFNGKYHKHKCIKRIKIDNEYDRINYLITFCLKNYYINQANMIEDGKFVPKWKHEWELEQEKGKDRIKYLIAYCLKNYYINQANEVENGKFIPKWKYEYELKRAIDNCYNVDSLSVTVNGERYNIIQ